MPLDDGYDDDHGSHDDGGRERRFKDFDCPECSANTPYDDSFGHGDEVRCYSCGQELRAEVTDSGRLKLKAI